jgi:hypothetical protein
VCFFFTLERGKEQIERDKEKERNKETERERERAGQRGWPN